MKNLVCLRMWNRAVMPQLVDGPSTKGQLGGPRSSSQALLTLVGCPMPGGNAQKGVHPSRALLALLICVSATVAASLRKAGDGRVQNQSCVVLRTGGKYASDGSGTLCRDSGYHHSLVFFGVEAADITSYMQRRPYTSHILPVNNWQRTGANASGDGEQKQTQQGQQGQSGRVPLLDQLFTRTALEEALSLLQENRLDVTEAEDVEGPLRKGVLPHHQVAPKRLGQSNRAGKYSGDGVPSRYPVDMEAEELEEQWAEEQEKLLDEIQSQGVLPDLLRSVHGRQGVADGSKTNTPGEIPHKHVALPNVHDDADGDVNVEADVAEMVEESILPAAEVGADSTVEGKHRELRRASVLPVVVQTAVWLVAVVLALALAVLFPQDVFAKQTSQPGRHDGGLVSPIRKDIEEEDYLELDRVVGSQLGGHDGRQVSLRKKGAARDVSYGPNNVSNKVTSKVFTQHVARL